MHHHWNSVSGTGRCLRLDLAARCASVGTYLERRAIKGPFFQSHLSTVSEQHSCHGHCLLTFTLRGSCSAVKPRQCYQSVPIEVADQNRKNGVTKCARARITFIRRDAPRSVQRQTPKPRPSHQPNAKSPPARLHGASKIKKKPKPVTGGRWLEGRGARG